ncbi:hypothetical protein CHS0354_021252 [Potamilus streckersoni]|uniref:Uncharacterized protein n=1 Tax=Potamilus streckersoni TaxID=2493646 RepID=A0AAE0VP40_9BIVA|nr:hypothetical protein CHS0354_021252 [Potamilus streckersoni]
MSRLAYDFPVDISPAFPTNQKQTRNCVIRDIIRFKGVRAIIDVSETDKELCHSNCVIRDIIRFKGVRAIIGVSETDKELCHS